MEEQIKILANIGNLLKNGGKNMEKNEGRKNLAELAGANLKRELKRQKVTQEELAERTFRDVRTVSRWVNQGINSLEEISYVAEELGISVMSILAFDKDSEDDIVPLIFIVKLFTFLHICNRRLVKPSLFLLC